ncbi:MULTISPECIES: hypothetical protein [unclassified Leifsonia]|uniref:hypothetical protein n=1 Tax=unclassified Leifsonia TaxID=2663824 RepID=UPI0006F6C481|nr:MULTISPECIES: hypothetical protein [unclassified Leifsonia]KQX06887.1 hypothetical protein ASC59_03415 [Leifsonia sp. Root1293]KRA11172.1 hypothetical protein ASD61_03415 [Leifsonia sp. Root60]
MTFLTTILTETEAASTGFPTIIFGVIALVIFAALGFVVWSFRDVANRHAVKADAYAAAHGGGHDTHGGGH